MAGIGLVTRARARPSFTFILHIFSLSHCVVCVCVCLFVFGWLSSDQEWITAQNQNECVLYDLQLSLASTRAFHIPNSTR